MYDNIPDVFDLVVLLAQARFHVAAQLLQRAVGRVESRLCVTQSVACVSQLGGQAVALALQLHANRRQLLHLSVQVLVGAVSLTQLVCITKISETVSHYFGRRAAAGYVKC